MGLFFYTLMLSPEAAVGGGRGLCGGGSDRTLHLLTYPHYPPLVAGSRSTAVVAERGHNKGWEGRRERKEEEEEVVVGDVSATHGVS